MVYEAFDIADQYGTPVIILADGMIGQMMEAVDFELLPGRRKNLPEKPWRLVGKGEKGYRTEMLLSYQKSLCQATWEFENITMPKIIKDEIRYVAAGLEDADIVLTAYGTAARMVKEAIQESNLGIKIGYIFPQTAWPFPEGAYDQINPECRAVICAEINTIGQMIDDVRIAARGRWPVYHVGNTRTGPLDPETISEKIESVWEDVK